MKPVRQPSDTQVVGKVHKRLSNIERRLTAPTTTARTSIDLTDYLDDSWSVLYPGATITKSGDYVQWQGTIEFVPGMTDADFTASEPSSVTYSHYYTTLHVISGVGTTVGKNAPTVPLPAGTPIPAEYRPAENLTFSLPVDSPSSDALHVGRSIHMQLTSAGYLLGYGGFFYPPVGNDAYGVDMNGQGFPGGGTVALVLDSIVYLAAP